MVDLVLQKIYNLLSVKFKFYDWVFNKPVNIHLVIISGYQNPYKIQVFN